MSWPRASRCSTCQARPAIQEVAIKTGMMDNTNRPSITISGRPSIFEKAQSEATQATPTRQKVSNVAPAAARKQPKGLKACWPLRGVLSGLINSCSMDLICQSQTSISRHKDNQLLKLNECRYCL